MNEDRVWMNRDKLAVWKVAENLLRGIASLNHSPSFLTVSAFSFSVNNRHDVLVFPYDASQMTQKYIQSIQI